MRLFCRFSVTSDILMRTLKAIDIAVKFELYELYYHLELYENNVQKVQ